MAPEISKCLEMSSPRSKFLSNAFAFINFNLLFSGSPSRNHPYIFSSKRDNGRPTLLPYLSDHQVPWFIFGACWNLYTHRIDPDLLSLNEVDPMFLFIYLAFLVVEFKVHLYIKNIPILALCQHFFAPKSQSLLAAGIYSADSVSTADWGDLGRVENRRSISLSPVTMRSAFPKTAHSNILLSQGFGADLFIANVLQYGVHVFNVTR
jgi:hypothetical protein